MVASDPMAAGALEELTAMAMPYRGLIIGWL